MAVADALLDALEAAGIATVGRRRAAARLRRRALARPPGAARVGGRRGPARRRPQPGRRGRPRGRARRPAAVPRARAASRSSPRRWPTRTSTASSPRSRLAGARRRDGHLRRRRRAAGAARRRTSPPAGGRGGAGAGRGVEPDPVDARWTARVARRPSARSSWPARLPCRRGPRARLVDDPDARATPASPMPRDATPTIRRRRRTTSGATRIGPTTFAWGARTFVMGILNVTPGLVLGRRPARRRRGRSRRGGRRPGAADGRRGRRPPRRRRRVDPARATRRSTPPRRSAASCRSSRPSRRRSRPMPISIDTTKPAVAEAALDAGADLINDVWGVGPDDAPGRLAADARRAASSDAQPRRAALRRRRRRGRRRPAGARSTGRCAPGSPRDNLIVDPGIGFGKTAEHNLDVLRDLGALRVARAGRSCSGTSRKSTLGRILDLPADERLEATLATTALGDRGRGRHRAGPRRPARTSARRASADAIVRGRWRRRPEGGPA